MMIQLILLILFLNKLKNEGVFFNSPLLTATNKLIYSTLDTSIRCGVVGLWSYLIQQGAEFDVYAKNIEKFIEDDFMNYTNFVEDDALKNISNIVGKNKTIYKELEEEIKTYDKIVTDNEYYSAISQFESEILDSISILKGRMFNGA